MSFMKITKGLQTWDNKKIYLCINHSEMYECLRKHYLQQHIYVSFFALEKGGVMEIIQE